MKENYLFGCNNTPTKQPGEYDGFYESTRGIGLDDSLSSPNSEEHSH